MFVGSQAIKLDDKGRVTLPAKYRKHLEEGLMVTNGQDRCLTIYPLQAFWEFAQRVAGPSTSDEAARSFRRTLLASSEEMTLDGQGRITLSGSHREYAGLAKECTVIGNWEHLEIWDTASWESYLTRNEEAFSRADHPSLGSIL